MEEKSAYLERVHKKLEQAKSVKSKFETILCNHQFIIYPNVFNPKVFFGTEFLAAELIQIIKEFQPKQPTMLETGTGAGYMPVLAILNGASAVTCTDINQEAIANANENVAKYNLQDKITVMYSDVFSGLTAGCKFDIMFWNFPFGHINKSMDELDMLDRAVFDPFYKSLHIFLSMGHLYLTPKTGRLFLGFSTSAGDYAAFDSIATKYKWRIELRNEFKSNTTPAMQIGIYELTNADYMQ